MCNIVYNGVYNENLFNFEQFVSDVFHSMVGGAGKVTPTMILTYLGTEDDKGYALYGFNMSIGHDQVFEVYK